MFRVQIRGHHTSQDRFSIARCGRHGRARQRQLRALALQLAADFLDLAENLPRRSALDRLLMTAHLRADGGSEVASCLVRVLFGLRQPARRWRHLLDGISV
jgi:hypothetical protein